MDVYLHNLSPFAFRISDSFGIRWYGLAYLAGFLLSYLSIYLICKRGKTPLTIDQAADLVTYGAIGVLAGGRIGYCLFYQPDLLVSFDSQIPYWGLLKVNEGGMASHGGIIGVMIVCYLYGKRHHIPYLHIMDLSVFGASLGFFFGRIANFINGELFGRAAPGVWWAVKFPQEMYLWSQREVSRLIEIGPAAVALGHIHTVEGNDIPIDQATWQGWMQNYTHDTGSRNAIGETMDQIITAIQNGNAKVAAALARVLTPRYPSQLIQAVLEGLIVFIFMCWLWRKPRKPGVITGWFGALYAIARIIGEQYRMPDAQIGFQLWGLTRGQWLSVGLLAASILWIAWTSRRNVETMGGFSST